jgi:hypothetical protein
MMERTCMGNDSQNALHLPLAAACLEKFKVWDVAGQYFVWFMPIDIDT